jgi:hypothetical protein
MKAEELLLEAPKKKPAKKKAAKKKAVKKKVAKKKTNVYKPQVIADLDLQEAAIAAAQKVAAFMQQKCQPWLQGTKNGQLYIYRGVSDRGGLAFTKKAREDRRPKDTEPTRHKAFNAAIEAAGGVANRSNSLFCGSRSQASSYGKVYILVPVGKFNFTWSPKWHDWTGDAENYQLKELLKPAAKDNTLEQQIKALQAQIPAYNQKKMKQAEAEVAKRIKSYPVKIAAAKKRLATLKDKNSWTAKDLKYDIQRYTKRLQEYKNPAYVKKEVNSLFKYNTQYDSNNPKVKIERLKRDSKDRPSKDLLDPKNYDPVKVKARIVADKDLTKALTANKEVMISCEAGLYIKDVFYKNFVLPTLKGKKITAKYSAESSNRYDDDDDWY